MQAIFAKLSGLAFATAILCWGFGADAQQSNQLSVPNVTVTAPAVPVQPPYLRNPWKSYERNPYAGRYRVEEDKFPEVPCNVTRIASSAGGKCLQGYKLIEGNALLYGRGPLNCDMALDVVMYNVGNLSIEASTLVTDPYKTTAIGLPGKYCRVGSYPGYDQEDFQDMNQVTRRGTNWRNLVSDGDNKSIEFSDGLHNCVAVRKPGPTWRGGYIYMMNASICRTDTAVVRAEDISYALDSLQIRQYDPAGNLRKAGQ
ncbi:MAG TPA: hypothetical protein VGI28_04190 [Stellaceae bacterium]